jgi:hypothetical protein
MFWLGIAAVISGLGLYMSQKAFDKVPELPYEVSAGVAISGALSIVVGGIIWKSEKNHRRAIEGYRGGVIAYLSQQGQRARADFDAASEQSDAALRQMQLQRDDLQARVNATHAYLNQRRIDEGSPESAIIEVVRQRLPPSTLPQPVAAAVEQRVEAAALQLAPVIAVPAAPQQAPTKTSQDYIGEVMAGLQSLVNLEPAWIPAMTQHGPIESFVVPFVQAYEAVSQPLPEGASPEALRIQAAVQPVIQAFNSPLPDPTGFINRNLIAQLHEQGVVAKTAVLAQIAATLREDYKPRELQARTEPQQRMEAALRDLEQLIEFARNWRVSATTPNATPMTTTVIPLMQRLHRLSQPVPTEGDGRLLRVLTTIRDGIRALNAPVEKFMGRDKALGAVFERLIQPKLAIVREAQRAIQQDAPARTTS